MRLRASRWLVVMAALLLSPAVAWPGGSTPDAPLNEPAMEAALRRFTATDLAGAAWSLPEMHGRVVLLDFWATWCAPCLAELPRLRALREKHAESGFEILGISLDVMSRQAFVSWLNRHRIDWPQVHDRMGYGGNVPRLFAVDHLPRSVLVARDGRIAAIDARGERLASLVEALVLER